MPSLLVRIKPSHLAQSRTVLRECHLQKRLRVPAFSVTVASFCRETRIVAEKFDWAIEISGI